MIHSFIARTLPLVPKPIVRRIAKRYVAGDSLRDGVEAVARLNHQGLDATLALLGEEVLERQHADAAVEQYLAVLDELRDRDLSCYISIKLTLLGLKIDHDYCRDNLFRIAAAAKEHDTFVRIDMEDHTCTEATLGLYHEAQARYGNMGFVLQAYMRRTPRDIKRHVVPGANVRLCKGIYVEPDAVAYSDYDTVRLAFLESLKALFDRGAYVGVATHDEYLLCGAQAEVERRGLGPDEVEFQMLLGVQEGLRDLLAATGSRVRVYVPYGREWYEYSIRRLRENPRIALYVLKALFS